MSSVEIASKLAALAAATGDANGGDGLDDVGGLAALMDAVVPVTLVIVLFLGLGLWVLGRRLARPACAVSGVVLGALGGLLVAELLQEHGAFAIPLVVGAGIAGGLIAALLFRVWMAMSGALVFALLVPAAMVVWHGAPPVPEQGQQPEPPQQPESAPPNADPDDEATAPPADEPTAEGMLGWLEDFFGIDLEEVEQVPGKVQRQLDEAPDPDEAEDAAPLRDTAGDRLGSAIDHGRERARGWYERSRDRLAAWWGDLSPGAKRGLAIGAGIGALLGLTLGLALPYTAAAVQSALAGAILMFLPLRLLVERHAPDWTGLLPQSPRAVLIWLGLITLLGVILQWTLFRKRRADR